MEYNTPCSGMPLAARTLDYDPFDALDTQPQDMLSRRPAQTISRRALHAALYVVLQAEQQGVHVSYTLTEVWVVSINPQQVEDVVGQGTPNYDAWSWSFDVLIVLDTGCRHTRGWTLVRIRL